MLIALVEDDRHIRGSLEKYLSIQPELELIFSGESVEDYLVWANKGEQLPDVVLLDVSLPGMTGIEGIKEIRKYSTEISIIILTIHDDSERVFSAFKEGANGYLLKSTPLAKIKEGILDIRSNGAPMSPSIAKKVIDHFAGNEKTSKPKEINPLTNREKDVVHGLVDGYSYKEIASDLDLSVETIRHHIKNIYSKLYVNSKSQVVAKSLRGEIRYN